MSAPQTVRELIASRPEEERIILTLHFLGGKSSDEIADLLRVPQKSVRALIDSGKERIALLMGL
jgi:DNA-directed RNA polymerase specialized sigma24 family protein